jgi:hypothetical protein
VDTIEECLAEISLNTNVKWWVDEDGLAFLHALNFKDHNKLRENRLGEDEYPNWPGENTDESGSSPGLVRPEVEVEVEEEVEVETPPTPPGVGDDIPSRLTEFMIAEIRRNKPDFKPQTPQNWPTVFDRMIRLDNRTAKQIATLIRWCQQDDFEMANVLSPRKLRKRFDQLELKMKRDTQNKEFTPKAMNTFRALEEFINDGQGQAGVRQISSKTQGGLP